MLEMHFSIIDVLQYAVNELNQTQKETKNIATKAFNRFKLY